ncbi:MAG: hypothetical protein R2867_09470 [Caldilineaceae bacterium]
MEVVLPVEITVTSFYKSALINPWGLVNRWKGVLRLSRGRLEGYWEEVLFQRQSRPNSSGCSTGRTLLRATRY